MHLDMEIVCFSREMPRDEPCAKEERRGEVQCTRGGESVCGVAGKKQLVPHPPLWPLLHSTFRSPLPSTFRSCLCPGLWGQDWLREQTLGLRADSDPGSEDLVVKGQLGTWWLGVTEGHRGWGWQREARDLEVEGCGG